MYSLFTGIGKESSVDRRFYLFSHLLTLLISQFSYQKALLLLLLHLLPLLISIILFIYLLDSKAIN